MNTSALRYDIEKALKEIGVKHGMNMTLGAITYSDFDFKASIKGVAVQVGEKSGAQLAFERDSAKFGLPGSFYGKVIAIDGKKFTVTGVNTRARKYPFIITDSEGKTYKVNTVTVLAGSGRID